MPSPQDERLREALTQRDYKRLPESHDGDGEEMWEDPAGHVMLFEDAVRLEFYSCKRCGKSKEMWQKYCGAACSAASEMKLAKEA